MYIYCHHCKNLAVTCHQEVTEDERVITIYTCGEHA